MELTTVLIAFGLTLFAGLSTGIGSALAFFAKQKRRNLLLVNSVKLEDTGQHFLRSSVGF